MKKQTRICVAYDGNYIILNKNSERWVAHLPSGGVVPDWLNVMTEIFESDDQPSNTFRSVTSFDSILAASQQNDIGQLSA
jgi:hypothetical protein